MPLATQSVIGAAQNQGQVDSAEPADLAIRVTKPVNEGEGETVAEHDWLATLELVRRCSLHLKQTDAIAKNLARNAEDFIRYTNQMLEESPSREVAKLSTAVLAGLGGIGLSWLALLWFIFAEDPFFGLKASFPAVTRHYLITLAQCALFTALAVTIIGVLQRGFRAWSSFYEAVLKRSARHDPGSAVSYDRKQVKRKSYVDELPLRAVPQRLR